MEEAETLAVVGLDEVQVRDNTAFNIRFALWLVVDYQGLEPSKQRWTLRRGERGWLGLQAEVFKDHLNRRFVLDHREQLPSTTAAMT